MHPPVAQNSQFNQAHLTGTASDVREVLNVWVARLTVPAQTVGNAFCPHQLAPRKFRTGSLQQRTQQRRKHSHSHRKLDCKSAQAAAPTQLEAVAEDKWIQRTLTSHSNGHSSDDDM